MSFGVPSKVINNAYCQDNEISWYDWKLLKEHEEIYRFAQGMIFFRRANPVLRGERFYDARDIRWLSPAGTAPDWSDPSQNSLARLIFAPDRADLFLDFQRRSHRDRILYSKSAVIKSLGLVVDTFRSCPEDLIHAAISSIKTEEYGITNLRNLLSAVAPNSKLTTASVSPEEAARNGWSGYKNPDGTVMVSMCLQCQIDRSKSRTMRELNPALRRGYESLEKS